MRSSREPSPPTEKATPDGAAPMGSKERTWPASVCQDPTHPTLWNVRGIDGIAVFTPGLETKSLARQACAGINAHFDHGAKA
jgi:hypothetical protein